MAHSEDAVRAWDLPTRVFHWTLVILLVSAWVSFRYAEAIGDYTLKWHRWNGYAILVLVAFRVLWGFVGSSTSRFSTFVRWPWHAAAYGIDLLRGRDQHYLGHNPLGTWMIIALLAALAAQGVLGLFTVEHNDITAGPLYRLVSEDMQKTLSSWHLWAFYWVILPLIGLHILANIMYGVVKKDPLIRAMITGRKPAATYRDAEQATIVANAGRRAVLALIAAVLLVFGTITTLGGKLFI